MLRLPTSVLSVLKPKPRMSENPFALNEDTNASVHVATSEAIHNHVVIAGPPFAANTDLRVSIVAQSSSLDRIIQSTTLVKLRGADGKMHIARAMIFHLIFS